MVKSRVMVNKHRNLAFWSDMSCIDVEEATKYLHEGERVSLMEEQFYYRAPWSDKPYYHVKHNIYGEGYVLAEAF